MPAFPVELTQATVQNILYIDDKHDITVNIATLNITACRFTA